MDEKTKKLIDNAKEIAMGDSFIDRETIISLLKISPNSEECEYLGKAAREVATVMVKNKARIGTSIGLDLCPCAANCKFCSLGEEWGLIKECKYLDDETVIRIVKEKLSEGFFQFSLRTTEYYDFDKLCALGKKIRDNVPGTYYLTANTGELTLEKANHLHECGFNGAYHVFRLGEGKDTTFDPEERIATMKAIAKSKLILATGVDPIGIEHTNEQIADMIIFNRGLNPMGICTMKRISVEGTPMGNIEEVSDIRMCQIAAVIRMSSKGSVAIHPAMPKAMEWGANNAACEIGVSPRKDNDNLTEWTFEHSQLVKWFTDAGYDMGSMNDFRH